MKAIVYEFVNKMLKIQEKKQSELDRRGIRTNELIQKSDQLFSGNGEQWEAYQHCINYQHDRMISLIHDLFVIRSILSNIKRGETT